MTDRTAAARRATRAGMPTALTAATQAIEIHGVSKAYAGTPVLRGLDLTVPDGSITAVLGASGSGKTTLLRIIAGFDATDTGTVSIGGRLVDDGHRGTIRPQHRAVGYVPQDAALFPHLTVASNIGFGVPRRSRARVAGLIELVGLTGYEHRYPHQLSGGQQQRVALARALAIQPSVVLLDEPFGSLDTGMRETVRADVARILTETGTTTVLVTHDQDEALSLADRIALLDAGRIIAHGTPCELYRMPPTVATATAIGIANILTGHIQEGRIRCALGQFTLSEPPAVPPGPCQLLLRPEDLTISTSPQAGQLPATVTRVRYHGHDTLVDLTADGQITLTARIGGPASFTPGQRLWVSATSGPHIFTSA